MGLSSVRSCTMMIFNKQIGNDMSPFASLRVCVGGREMLHFAQHDMSDIGR
jgi:hypothetical protein